MENLQRNISHFLRVAGRSRVWRRRARIPFVLIVFATLAAPWGAASTPAARMPLSIDVPVFDEGFEGVFPGGNWSANDTNASSGFDYWSTSTYRAASGNASLWSAGNGSQLARWDAGQVPPVNASNVTNQTIFFDGFEDATFSANWTSVDQNSGSGNDTWGVSTARPFAGAASMWSAQEGYNDELLDTNVKVASYDNDQASLASRSIDLSNLSSGTDVVLEYWWWLESEACCDYLYPLYYDQGGWYYPSYDSGSSQGWTFASVSIPSSSTAVGFYFSSDGSVLAEGAYIDNVTVIVPAPPRPPQPAGPFEEDFEPVNASGNWSASDSDTYAGKDTWGISTARAHTGASSLWSAQVGQNSNWGAPNVDVAQYDDGMYALVWRPIDTSNLSNFPSATLRYWYWLDSETGFDYFSAMTYNDSAGWTELNALDGNSGGWVFNSLTVSNDTTKIGFLFQSDTSSIYEGAYVDDVEFFATRNDPNAGLRTYDTFMNASVGRVVNLAPYWLAYLSYSYWLATDSPNDTLDLMALTGTNWTTLDRVSGNSSGWRSATFELPTSATRVAFRFISDGTGHSEGAYLDDVHLWGVVLPVNCTISASAVSGVERLTAFLYTLDVTEGLRPYRFAWNFSDGAAPVIQSPSRTFPGVGTYSARVIVTDAMGQTCQAAAPDVVVSHDLSAVSVAPTGGTLIEGQNVTLTGADALGHAIDFSWVLSPPECGALSSAVGPSVLFTADGDAGGLTCTVRASAGGASALSSFDVLHDSRVLSLRPSAFELVEGQSLAILAADAFGHGLTFGWAASCGRVTPSLGSTTTFTADQLGGQVCSVRASGAMGSANVSIFVVHDTRTLVVAPGSATILEGSNSTFSVVDAYGHPAMANWSVSPSSCGNFSASPASLTVFTASLEAGGSTCTASAAALGGLRSVEVVVRHSFAVSAITPSAVTAPEGAQRSFFVLDTFGHPFAAAWDLAPSQCGALSAASGTSTTLNVSVSVGVLTCAVRASAPGVSLLSTVMVIHGGPASVVASANVTSALEGGKVALEAAVHDAAGHTLAGPPITWSASCGALDNERGTANAITILADAGGTTCEVTASHGAFSQVIAIVVRHAGPFTLAVSVTGTDGGPQTFTATVKDQHDHVIPNATVVWTATCGALSREWGPATTFTPPGDLGGSKCRVTATSTVGAETDQVVQTVTTGMSAAVPLAAILAAAGAVALLLFLRKRKAKGKSP